MGWDEGNKQSNDAQAGYVSCLLPKYTYAKQYFYYTTQPIDCFFFREIVGNERQIEIRADEVVEACYHEKYPQKYAANGLKHDAMANRPF